jgi:membrane carboxypeptidase/penicillin-binding protein PbpC
LPLCASFLESGPVYWFVDGALFRAASSAEPVAWPLRPGEHRIACADARGRSAAVEITVE